MRDVTTAEHEPADATSTGDGTPSVPPQSPNSLLADYDRAKASAKPDILCSVIARHPAATAADLRKLLEAHPALGEMTLAELFFEHAGDRGGGEGHDVSAVVRVSSPPDTDESRP